MYTLDIKKWRRIYLGATAFCILFSLIYEHFSHEVYSIYMLYPILILFLLGFLVVSFFHKKITPWALSFYNTFLAFLAVGCYIKGILEIFGTTNDLVTAYFFVSIFFLILTFIFLWKENKK